MDKDTRGRGPSAYAIVAVVALVAALGGTAIAGTDVGRKLDKKEQKQVTKIAKKEAGKLIDSRAAGLSVDKAKSADTATTADIANSLAAGSVKAGSLGTLVTKQVSENIPNNTAEGATVTCDPGQVMITGGTATNGVGLVQDWTLIRSGPDPNGWSAAANNDTGSAGDLIVKVVCLAP